MSDTLTGLELRSLISRDGILRISLEPVGIGEPASGEIVVRVEATPINPSDLGLLFGPTDTGTLKLEADGRAAIAEVPAPRLASVAGRLGQALPVGNEGAGTIVRAAPDLQHLIGRKVAMWGGGMYAQLRRLAFCDCIVLPENASAAEGASLFVNPLTALGFVETMREEGHSAIVHTAAASNLGQMLIRICLADDIPLVNVVRSREQVALLRGIGAKHVVDSSAPNFAASLTDAIAATGATLGFDAVGGGELAGHLLNAMEAVAARDLTAYNRYGSDRQKKVYVYGSLDTGPVILNRRFGFAWDIGGWLLFHFLRKASPEVVTRMRNRVAAEMKTTFASRYTATISLTDILKPEIATAYLRKGTGAKYLIDPTL